jgi:hypothetical protein
MITAGQLCLVAALGLSLFHRHAFRDGEANLPLALADITTPIALSHVGWEREDSRGEKNHREIDEPHIDHDGEICKEKQEENLVVP